MNFVSASFVIFLGVVLVLHAFLVSIKREQAARDFLLAASLFFYAYHNISYLPLLIVIGLLSYAFGLYISKTNRTNEGYGIAPLPFLILLIPLFYYKYTQFFFEDVIGGLTGWELPVDMEIAWGIAGLALPLGISFYTFQAISYVTDVHRNRILPELSLKRFLLYISFFPQLIAGPVVTAREFFPELAGVGTNRRIGMLREAAFYLFSGYLKKAVLSDHLALIVDPVFSKPQDASWRTLVLVMFAYSLQIYLDFSGYSDMALGLGRLFGIRLPENFQFPYHAASFREFWRRWHITLSIWLRDHIYIPLGGSRSTPIRMMLALFMTMVLGGLWHGAHWNFIIWGSAHGLLLVLERFLLKEAAGYRWIRTGATFFITTILWVLFRTGTGGGFSSAMQFYRGVVSLRSGSFSDMDLWFVTLVLILVFISPLWYSSLRRSFQSINLYKLGIVCAAGLFFLIAFSPGGAPFIYFVF